MMKSKFKNEWKSTLKSKDTEEWIDLHFYRAIGYYLTLFFKKKGITPNQVTIISIFLGIIAGFCFRFDKLSINLCGIFLLILANSFDSADGQLARMINKKSLTGRILDGICGILWFASIYIAIIFRSKYNFIFLFALFAGFWHLKQTSMADYYRNLHLFFFNGGKGSEFDNSKTLIKKHILIDWKKHSLIKLLSFFYINYTKKQEEQTPNLQKFLHLIKTNYKENIPEWLRKSFLRKSFPLIKYTNLLSFNLRSIILFICILLNIPSLYFIFEITIMNLLLFYMISRYEYICLSYLDKI